MADLAELVGRFGVALRSVGLPVDAGRCARFATAVTVVDPVGNAAPLDTTTLYWCARSTLISDPEQVPAFDRVFWMVFLGMVDPTERRGQPGESGLDQVTGLSASQPGPSTTGASSPLRPTTTATCRSTSAGSGKETLESTEAPVPAMASAAERLAGRDFDQLTPEELAELVAEMRWLRVHTPLRRTRRQRRCRHGRSVDLRATLRAASRTGAQPIRLLRRRQRTRPRKLVVLCDISGSMQHYARAMLQLLYCAGGGANAEVFTFATRLTRLTSALRRVRPEAALARAAELAPDWSGGTRIAAALREFTNSHGRRGMARGAVVVIVSDGWETGEPAALAEQMARLSRLTHRIVWANPRTARSRYQPLVGGMAAAWPYCDAVVSAHSIAALDELLAAIGEG
ncbi:MAG: vWA domain-containing protein [Sciscionella sp.]